jgi:hypothetical protein
MLTIDTNPQKMTFRKAAFNLMSFWVMTLSIITFWKTTQHDENQQNDIPNNLNSSKCQVNDPQHKVLYFFIV